MDQTKSTIQGDFIYHAGNFNILQQYPQWKCLGSILKRIIISICQFHSVLLFYVKAVVGGCGRSLGMEVCCKMRTKQSWIQKYLQFVWRASMFLIFKRGLTGTIFLSKGHSWVRKGGVQRHIHMHECAHLNKQNRSIPVSRFSRHSWLPFHDPHCSITLRHLPKCNVKKARFSSSSFIIIIRSHWIALCFYVSSILISPAAHWLWALYH